MGGCEVGAQSRSQGLEGVCWLSGLEDFREKERHRKKEERNRDGEMDEELAREVRREKTREDRAR